MKYKINNSMRTGEFESKFGKMVKYTVQFDGEAEAVEIVQKPESPEPKTGDEVEGDIETTQYGRKFKRERQGYNGGGGKSDPATQKAIIRQNSLTNAVAYCTAKANLMEQKEALKYLTGKGVIQTATYFAKYSEGNVTVVTESEKKEELPEKDVDETPPAPTDNEINIEDLPF